MNLTRFYNKDIGSEKKMATLKAIRGRRTKDPKILKCTVL